MGRVVRLLSVMSERSTRHSWGPKMIRPRHTPFSYPPIPLLGTKGNTACNRIAKRSRAPVVASEVHRPLHNGTPANAGQPGDAIAIDQRHEHGHCDYHRMSCGG